jgi:hypothetical protein
VLAKRLETTTLKVPRASGKQLQGNLKFFDLATVIQTLIGSHQTGSLVVSQDGSKQKIAEIFFFKGNIARAKYRHLAGDDAVFQLFQSPLEGEFCSPGATWPRRSPDRHHDAGDLAAHGIGPSPDSCPCIGPHPDAERLQAKAAQLKWPEAETGAGGSGLVASRRASVNDLQRDIPRCSFAIYRTMVTLWTRGRSSETRTGAVKPADFADLLAQGRPSAGSSSSSEAQIMAWQEQVLTASRKRPLTAIPMALKQVLAEGASLSVSSDRVGHGDADAVGAEAELPRAWESSADGAQRCSGPGVLHRPHVRDHQA